MGRSVQAIHDLTRQRPHLIVSLDAPAYRLGDGGGRRIGQPLPRLPRWVPCTVPTWLRARTILTLLREFEPTHLLLRTSGLLGTAVLRQCVRRHIDTLVILAEVFHRPGRRERRQLAQFVGLLSDPCVFLVGNHRVPATQSMIESGVGAAKAAAYDFAPARDPANYPEKTLEGSGPRRLVYVGSMLLDKGVAEVIDATAMLARRGVAVTATLAGDGPDLEALRRRTAALPVGLVSFAGRIGNDQAFELMRQAALVCVPSRPSYHEGMPLTLTEALASRTPVIVSDHPVMTRAFHDGEGVRFFPAGDAGALARTAQAVLADAGEYRRLSRSTAAAYARVECRTLMPDLIARWGARI
jgi:glycosyltransferase involved in cell wall biosynthesis